MTSYKNLAGNVGICSYELGEQKISIKFHSRKSFLYDTQTSSKDHIDSMKRLAIQGFGLNYYINENDADLKAIALD